MSRQSMSLAAVILVLQICQLLMTKVSAQAFVINAELSSPSSITAMKNSAVWLHWNYTFNDGNGLVTFIKQQWTANDTLQNKVNVIAERDGLSGQIIVSSSLPSALAGRVIAFSGNGTLMIKNLHYNDTVLQLKSTAFVQVRGTSVVVPKDLSPVVTLTVEGAPSYLSTPSTNIEVSENSLLSIVTRFDCNPKPHAKIQWSDSTDETPLEVHEEYPFIYKTKYTLNQIAPGFCGKTLTLRTQNTVGKAADNNIAVTVLLSLNNPSLRAGKPNQTCVEVQWQKKESGLCSVRYTVNFKDKNGTVVYTNTEINKPGTTKCGIPSSMDIDQVELTMSSTKRSEKFTALVSEKALQTSTKAPKTKGVKNVAVIGGTIGGLLAVILFALLVIYFLKRGKLSPGSQDKSQFLQLSAKGGDSTTVEQPKEDKIS